MHYVGSTVHCGQDSCPRSFANFKYLKAHIEGHHSHLLQGSNDDTDDSAMHMCAGVDVDDGDMDTDNNCEKEHVLFNIQF